ncbi:pyruvate, phosphate dikinase [Paenibacillus sp. Soil522]|uniref:pyruvate, phosphate dikinase n=1 Tax=Paenibacillus sp. Soil522 TaxID=1736388 RepID=UPI0006F2EA92|nr:pyruvate, phosphate dikinase [Paenibacillus sp. Soil522]KRE49680.1 pyruvate phosphate dikinase [Paenibacillus sp. Soil522]
MSTKRVFDFTEGDGEMRSLLGGKGANLAEMTRAGLPVPPGYTITTEACLHYFKRGDLMDDSLKCEIFEAMERLETQKGQRFGGPQNPLLVSVRSGSVTSMPGMMDTILNLGLNDETVQGLADTTGNARFAFDCYRRLIQMFGNVVFGIEHHYFENKLSMLLQKEEVNQEQQLSEEALRQLIEIYKECVIEQAGRPFPQDSRQQLLLAVEAVFKSWHNPRAKYYRKINHISDKQGTAVNIQSMVFGNTGKTSGTGVLFTRNPSTGANELFGEFLYNAQGEDVVAGIRTPLPIAQLEEGMPEVYEQLITAAKQLEQHFKDMQDIEFTVEQGKLYILQTRNGKRNAQAAVRLAVELVHEQVITKNEAIMRIEASHLDQLLHRGLDESKVQNVLAVGLAASPGASTGQLVFDTEQAVEWSKAGKKVILARPETTPEDIQGMLVSEGVFTSRGGLTSHAAVVARGMGRSCVCGCEAVRIDPVNKVMYAGSSVLSEGDWITLDGGTGRIIEGKVPLREAEMSRELEEILRWSDEVRDLRVLANADTPRDAAVARRLGAEGIGLCRTEHMFFSPARLPVVQRMILAESIDERKAALEKILPMQQSDFYELFKSMSGLPVTIRLLDPPLHEFLPNLDELHEQKLYVERQEQLAVLAEEKKALRAERQQISEMIQKVDALQEKNPMLGQRGCRVGIVYPEIYDMQIEAIFKAVSRCLDEGVDVIPELMIPLVGDVTELKVMRELVDRVALQVLGKEKIRYCPYKVGTMIEVPRAALTAKRIAAHADFFSFGTNDLTQMTFGYSRDDAEHKFLAHYLDHKILQHNPFQVLDTEGVGQLIELAVASGRSVKPRIKTGICGEHGGDLKSIFYCHEIGLDYVSCSPYRIPLARIAAAQAAIHYQKEKDITAAV